MWRKYGLSDLAMVLALLMLTDCAGTHQTTLQEDSATPPNAQQAPESDTHPKQAKAAEDVTATANDRPSRIPKSVYEKKLQFFGLLRPIVETENAHILKQRHRLLQLQRKDSLSRAELHELRRLAARYRVKMPQTPDRAFWTTMLKRIDIIPMELVLAQAANESAWGTSRFARKGNNFFGEWCFSKGCGIVPARRDDGAIHEVEAFDSPRESVDSYIHNLNTLDAYSSLRDLRYHLRKAHRPLKASLLAIGLAQYSERGHAYVRSIRTFIRVNRDAMHAAAGSGTAGSDS